MKPNPPYYVGTYGGYLAIEDADDGRVRTYMVADVRLASPFDSFAQADAAAKLAVEVYPPDLAYFAIFTVARG